MAIKVGSRWVHHNGDEYEVLVLANTRADSERMNEYPPTVVCKRLRDETVWTRSIERWHGSFVEIPQYLVDGKKVKHVILNGQHEVVGYLVEPGDFIKINEVKEIVKV